MKFCNVCDNIMYIKTSEETGTVYSCKNCTNNEPIATDGRDEAICITDTQLSDDSIKYMRYVSPLLLHDPTMPHVSNVECRNPTCSRKSTEPHDVIVVKYDYDRLKFLYSCAYCSAFWITGSPSSLSGQSVE